MSYRFKSGFMYRMPTHFGPSLGPRQGPSARRFPNEGSPHKITRSVSYLTTAEAVRELLPDRFETRDEPVVTVTATYMTEIEWLAGRGYNTLGVTCPVRFRGESETVDGSFQLVLWENMADPIITGREELGYPKIFCELPEPTVASGETRCWASWMGFRFMDLSVSRLRPIPVDDFRSAALARHGHGVLMLKYMPRTGEWGESDSCYVTMTPVSDPARFVREAWIGEGEVRFHEATWQDMPTQYPIVNVLRSLPWLADRGAVVTVQRGGIDYRQQRIVR